MNRCGAIDKYRNRIRDAIRNARNYYNHTPAVGDVIRYIPDVSILKTLRTNIEYVVIDVTDNGKVRVYNPHDTRRFTYSRHHFKLIKKAEEIMVNLKKGTHVRFVENYHASKGAVEGAYGVIFDVVESGAMPIYYIMMANGERTGCFRQRFELVKAKVGMTVKIVNPEQGTFRSKTSFKNFTSKISGYNKNYDNYRLEFENCFLFDPWEFVIVDENKTPEPKFKVGDFVQTITRTAKLQIEEVKTDAGTPYYKCNYVNEDGSYKDWSAFSWFERELVPFTPRSRQQFIEGDFVRNHVGFYAIIREAINDNGEWTYKLFWADKFGTKQGKSSVLHMQDQLTRATKQRATAKFSVGEKVVITNAESVVHELHLIGSVTVVNETHYSISQNKWYYGVDVSRQTYYEENELVKVI